MSADRPTEDTPRAWCPVCAHDRLVGHTPDGEAHCLECGHFFDEEPVGDASVGDQAAEITRLTRALHKAVGEARGFRSELELRDTEVARLKTERDSLRVQVKARNRTIDVYREWERRVREACRAKRNEAAVDKIVGLRADADYARERLHKVQAEVDLIRAGAQAESEEHGKRESVRDSEKLSVFLALGLDGAVGEDPPMSEAVAEIARLTRGRKGDTRIIERLTKERDEAQCLAVTRLPGRKGQRCRVLIRARRMWSALVEFEEDGFKVVTSIRALRRAAE